MGTTRRTNANQIKVTTLAAALGLGSILGLIASVHRLRRDPGAHRGDGPRAAR